MNTKKPKPPKNLISETVVEINTDFATAVERLADVSGPGRDQDSTGDTIGFYSTRKGRFQSVDCGNNNRYHVNHRNVGLWGGLYVEDGKTKAVLYTYRQGGTVFGMIMEIIVGLVLLCCVAWNGVILLEREFSAGTLAVCGLMAIFAIAFPIHGILSLERGKRGSEEDAKKLQEDVLRRLNAINNWDK